MSTWLINQPKDAILGWAGAFFGITFVEPCAAVGIMRNHKLVGAVIYNCQDARNIEMTCIAPHVLTLKITREIFHIAFDEHQYNARRISLTVRAKRGDLIRKLERWGFVIEGMKRDYYDDDHAIILGMTRAECRFLRPHAEPLALAA